MITTVLWYVPIKQVLINVPSDEMYHSKHLETKSEYGNLLRPKCMFFVHYKKLKQIPWLYRFLLPPKPMCMFIGTAWAKPLCS